MKLSFLQISLIANAVLLAIALFLGWRLAGAAPRCDLKQATNTGKANFELRKEEGTRDKKLDKVATTTKADARKDVRKAQEQTRARAEAIDRLPADGSCRRPDGLPDLSSAVDQANAASGD
ncbi:hypothetical protein [Lysobacter fragariae]